MNTDTALRAIIPLLFDLHDLLAVNLGDSPEAEVIRDRMDKPWYQLNASEREFVGILSEELYKRNAVKTVLNGNLNESC